MNKNLIIGIIIVLLHSGCSTIFNRQVDYVNSSIKGNNCFDTKCTLEESLHLIALTKNKWKYIKFKENDFKILELFFKNDYPSLAKEYITQSKCKDEQEVFRKIITFLLDEMNKNNNFLAPKGNSGISFQTIENGARDFVESLRSYLFGSKQSKK